MIIQAYPRYSLSMALAALITAGLLLVMQGLIETGRDPVVESVHRLLPVLARVIEEPVPTPRKKVEPPPPPAVQPTITETTREVIDGGIGVEIAHPTGPVDRGNLTLRGEMNGAPIALVKIAAVYPQRAIVRGLEGYVIVEYTVTRTGSVADVRVVESSDAIFERSAIAAAEQFRYKPRIVGGEAVATPGVLNKFTFSFED